MKRNCNYCGKEYEYTPHRSGARYCSKKCEGRKRSAESEVKRARVCQCCGIAFIMNHPSGKAMKGEVKEGLFCSRKCRWEWMKDQPKKSYPSCKVWFPKCEICGKLFTTRRKGKTLCYSRKCSNERSAKTMRERYASDLEWREKQLEKMRRNNKKNYVPKKRILSLCKECGTFTTNKLFCSKACQERDAERNRRMRKRKAFVKRVYRDAVFKRDGYKCQICGKKVNMKLKAPHPRSASLDHIVPLARGGKHEPKNVQLAHFGCNSSKGKRYVNGGNQLRLFG